MAASHNFTVRSSLAEASRVPSGLNATLKTVPRVPSKGAEFLARGRVPQLHRLVPTRRGQPRPVRAERHATDLALCAPRGCGCSWPEAASHSFTVSSSLADASRAPSGLNATLQTVPVCP